ncbi:unnamed protein product [Lymnaea stagnalis]|uniref:Uncharacterized protein n=1 Tax=Lymnaea stagnalis TaxID=6523 RepID=A0AAV2I4G6_LYMST
MCYYTVNMKQSGYQLIFAASYVVCFICCCLSLSAHARSLDDLVDEEYMQNDQLDSPRLSRETTLKLLSTLLRLDLAPQVQLDPEAAYMLRSRKSSSRNSNRRPSDDPYEAKRETQCFWSVVTCY